MAVTISLYNHTARLFAAGENLETNTYKVKLFASATFDAVDATLGDVAGTEASTGTGYTAGGQTLANVAVTTVTTNGARFDADDVVWTATGGPITAAAAVLYNDSLAGGPPLAFIDFGGTESAGDTTDFKIVWNASGIFTVTVA